MAEHVMRIACLMLNAFVKKALGANFVISTKDQHLRMHRLVSLIPLFPEIIVFVY